jgi:hypothetical protein
MQNIIFATGVQKSDKYHLIAIADIFNERILNVCVFLNRYYTLNLIFVSTDLKKEKFRLYLVYNAKCYKRFLPISFLSKSHFPNTIQQHHSKLSQL